MKYKYLFYYLAGWVIITLVVIGIDDITVAAQQPFKWSPQQRIPGYNNETWPPYLIADHNRTIHAFASQQVGEDEKEIAIIYNQWTLEKGWTTPIDILLSPLKHEARLLGAFLDQAGTIHVVFFGGDGTEANIYYAKAPAIDMGRASAWSSPTLVGEAPLDPESGAITGDDKGNLVIIYSGKPEGYGYYALSSNDQGNTWSDAVAIFQTYSDQLLPWGLQTYVDKSGWLHAVWNVVDISGQGREIDYARMNFETKEWSEPAKLAETSTGLGTMHPAVIEHQGNVFVIYINTPKVVMRRSNNSGQTWTDPTVLFARHVGVNGTLSLVTDVNDNLHLFWGQRITGNPDIHGMWHSIWQAGDRWSEPEAVISGPQSREQSDKGFDPFNAHAVTSQGNTLLVTWRSDPGQVVGGNGVWYSYKLLDAPELPLVPLPVPVQAVTTAIPTVATFASTPSALLTPQPREHRDSSQVTTSRDDSGFLSNPVSPLILSLIPITLLLGVVIIIKKNLHHSH